MKRQKAAPEGGIVRAMTAMRYSQPEGIWRDHWPPNADGPEAEWERLYFRPPPGQRPTNTHVRVLGRANQR